MQVICIFVIHFQSMRILSAFFGENYFFLLGVEADDHYVVFGEVEGVNHVILCAINRRP